VVEKLIWLIETKRFIKMEREKVERGKRKEGGKIHEHY